MAKAILNNNDLYEAVFSTHNVKTHQNDSIWYCLEKTPPLYSNIVTVSEDWQPNEIFRTIEANLKIEKWSIKDSFNRLDLREYGFEKLFDASWIYLEAASFKPLKADSELICKIVESGEELSNWRIAWDADEKLGKQIFNAKILDDPNVFFIAGFDGKKIVSGCLINKTADVLGVSNFFAPDKSLKYWSEIIDFAFVSIEAADIVGYERKDLANELQSLGFETIGDLTVWLKTISLSP